MNAASGSSVQERVLAGARTRKLTASDLAQIVEIDEASGGRPRPSFFTKRVAALDTGDGGHLALGVERDGLLLGFALVRILDGEFGGVAPVGVLDAIGVHPAARRAGIGRALLRDLASELRRRGAVQLRTQASWHEHDLIAFFSSAGFDLAPNLVLERAVASADRAFADESDADLSIVHALAEDDLPAIIRIDTRITGRDRTVYYRRLVTEALHRSGLRVSLVAETDGQTAGFLMARLDYGDFGLPEPTAVLDTIGVDPAFAHAHLARTMLEQLLLNLRSLRVEWLRTEVEWQDLDLLTFLAHTGFAHSQRLAFALDLRGSDRP